MQHSEVSIHSVTSSPECSKRVVSSIILSVLNSPEKGIQTIESSSQTIIDQSSLVSKISKEVVSDEEESSCDCITKGFKAILKKSAEIKSATDCASCLDL